MITTLWTIFEILVNYYQGFMEIGFVDSVMKSKQKNNEKQFKTVFSLLIGTIITVFNHFTLFEGVLGIIVYWMCSFCYAILFLDGNIIMKLFYSSNPVIVLVPISSLSLNYVSSLNNMSIDEIVISQGIPRFIVLLVAQFLFYVVLKLLSRMYKLNGNSFNNTEFLIILFYIFFAVLLACILHRISMQPLSDSQRLFINISILLLVAINIIEYIMIGLLKQKNQQIQEFELNKLHDEYQKIYIEEAKMQYDSIAKVRHDIKNQLSALYGLLEDDNTEAAKKYISENVSVIKGGEPKIHSCNEIVNAIVNMKLTTASIMGVSVSCVSANELDGVSNIDWCNLLSNMLDNAIAACMELPEDMDKHIELLITKEENTYTVITSNTIASSVLADNPGLVTTKRDKKDHGLGTKIIKDIAQKYNGTHLFYEDCGKFICKLILKI